MQQVKKIIPCLFVILFAIANSNAQNKIPGKELVFSAIKGSASKPAVLQLPPTASKVNFLSGDSAAFKIQLVKGATITIIFNPAADFTGIAKATVKVENAAGKTVLVMQCSGLSTKGLEGENEAPLSTIAAVLGYQVNIGWQGLANNSLPQLQGDEINASLFHKATNGKVTIIPVARYSPDFELPFGYYVSNNAMPEEHTVGVLAKAGAFPEHQTLFPAMASGINEFDPGKNAFGFFATGPTHSAYSEDVWNMLRYPANAVHATRIYPVKDSKGKLIPYTYLLCFEEAKNGDFNDYVFLVKNIVPDTKNDFIKLFNEKNLDGWHTFLQDIGVNKDPNNNFTIQDGALHVLGKDLGYAITENAYSNYHFKVDFKWGESKWGSRTKEKRDAGVCYNIPVNEPDSIWPQSIECQIQEGDVGDFWLLGFSTITVNGVQNKPANHTRMIKQRDAEKPTGEWNTLEIISYNGKCVHIVNGVVVNAGEAASVKEGRILLQSEFAEIYYRNVLLRKL